MMAKGEQNLLAMSAATPMNLTRLPPILDEKHYGEASTFTPQNLLREARRQKAIAETAVPPVCVLDPDGDLVRRLKSNGRARLDPSWSCYHTELYRLVQDGLEFGLVGCAVGASFAVLVAEQLFACGCRLLLSLTSAGQITPAGNPPYFVIIDRALRDEGTSYHYAAPSEYGEADPRLVKLALAALEREGLHAVAGSSWTTDAPFRETAGAIEAAQSKGVLAVEMEAAALYSFANSTSARVLCLAHVTNTMGQTGHDFEKGEADGTADALRILEAIVRSSLVS